MLFSFIFQNIEVKDDSVAQKYLIRCKCIPAMKQGLYTITMVIKYDGTIDTVSCQCPSGRGTHSSCKHTAAVCYALSDFVREFIEREDEASCTDELQSWNRPRAKTLEPVPTFEMNFKKKKYAKQTKEIKGKAPSEYNIDQVCTSDIKSANKFLTDLRSYQDESGNIVGLLQVVNIDDPIKTIQDHDKPIHDYLINIDNCIKHLKSNTSLTADAKCEELINVMQVNSQLRTQIETVTQKQSVIKNWFVVDKKQNL